MFMQKRLKMVRAALMVLVLCGGLYSAHAYYDPGTQRWLNRDPIGESGGLNLYDHVRNDPVNFIDMFGLDLYPVQDSQWPHHRGIIVDNPDTGGYWYTDFTPQGGRAITAPGQYGYTPAWSWPPDKPQPEGYEVTCRIRTTPEVDRTLRDRAAHDSENRAPRYWCLGPNNCWSYIDRLVNQATTMMQPPPISNVNVNAPPAIIVRPDSRR
jgi:uncharacterized protein RhaS with RHS repeats